MNSLWSEHKAPDGRSYFYNATTGESTWDRPADFIPQQPPLPGAGAVAAGGFAGGFGSFAGNRNGFPGDAYGAYGGFGNPYGGPAYGGQQMQHPGPPIQKGKQAQGPPGCNLFVFHIPNNMTTRELYNMFAPFGNVVSARIMVERETGRSRGFGFVSFDNYQSADASIRALDGYQVGPKRLKVSLKKEGDGEGPGGGGRGGGKGSQGGGQGQFDEGMPQGGPGGPGPTGGYVDGGYAPHGGYGGPGGVPPPTGVPMQQQQQQVGGPMGGYSGPVGHIDGTAQQAGGPQ